MLIIIFSWVFFFILIVLVGMLIIKKGEWYEYFWVGFAAVLAILQIWSLFLPVNVYSLMFVVFIACISAVIRFRKGIKLPRINYIFVFWTGIILFLISYFASLSGGWPDTCGYHLSIVKWNNLYKIVPGLANLYNRLGFNSSFFLFPSMMETFILKDRTSHIALSLATSVLSIQYLWIFLRSKNMYLKTFVLISLPIFIEGIVHTTQVSSFSYDYALLIIVFAICVELIKNNKKSLYLATVLSTMLITIKLSGVVFALIVIISVFAILVFKKERFLQTLFIFGIICLLFIIPYIARNVILSGWPFYPLPLFKFNVFWATPEEKVTELFEVIKGWAILPGSYWHTVVDQPFTVWFPGWFFRNINAVEFKIFFLTILIIATSILFRFIDKKTINKSVGLVIVGIASFASILYLIFSAPDFRFGSVYFWVFLSSVGSLFFSRFLEMRQKSIFFVVIFSLLMSIIISKPIRLDGEIMLKSIRWDQPGLTDIVTITPKDGGYPFTVNMARETSFCGNAPLPCTSEVNNDFKEIVHGDVSKGFAPIK